MTDELYRLISDDEFRGEGYFEATFKNELEWLEPTPPGWKAAFRKGDRYIVQEWNKGLFQILAVERDGQWRDPIASYAQNHRYIIEQSYLEIGIAR